MRPYLLHWLLAHDLPVGLAPSYATMIGLSALVSAVIVLSRTEREGGDVRSATRTLLVAYVGALAGGYLYELLRLTPEAVATGSIHPYLHVGRAAYGGLLFGSLFAALDLRRQRQSVGAFLDRFSLALGFVFLLVRSGCLLEGCDFGLVTEGPLSVSYPPGSLAALTHEDHGWIALGAPSLPTHPTQLYEGLFALLGSALAFVVYRRVHTAPELRGAAFSTWLLTYALGRAAVESLRGDADRGLYAGWSTAQWTSLLVFAGALASLVWLLARPRPRLAGPEVAHAA